MKQFSNSTLAKFERQRDFMRVAPRVLPVTLRDRPYSAHNPADVKAARNILYLYSKGVLPGYEPSFDGYDEQGEPMVSKPGFSLGARYTTVITNDNIKRDERKAALYMQRKAALFMLCPTIER